MNSQGAIGHGGPSYSHPSATLLLVVLASHLPSLRLSFFICEIGYHQPCLDCKN